MKKQIQRYGSLRASRRIYGLHVQYSGQFHTPLDGPLGALDMCKQLPDLHVRFRQHSDDMHPRITLLRRRLCYWRQRNTHRRDSRQSLFLDIFILCNSRLLNLVPAYGIRPLCHLESTRRLKLPFISTIAFASSIPSQRLVISHKVTETNICKEAIRICA